MCEVLTIGEPMVMFLADTKQPLSQVDHFTKMIAGADLNVALGLSRLGHSVSYMTQVGEDPFGEYIKDFLKKEQIDTSYIKETNEAPTGFQIKNQVDAGDPEVIYFRKGSAASKATKELLRDVDFSGSKILHVTGIFPALSASQIEPAAIASSFSRFSIPPTLSAILSINATALSSHPNSLEKKFTRKADSFLVSPY